MSSAAACKTVHVSPSPHDSVGVTLSQSGLLTHDQGQMLSAEVTLLEMSEAEYTHLQHLFQVSMETQASDPGQTDARSHPPSQMVKGATSATSFLAAQAIDLSTSTDECSVMNRQPGEKTPTTYGEVPAFVLAKVNSDDSLTEPPAKMRSLVRPNSSARVCLEKRFMTIFKQSAEPQEAVSHPQVQKSMDTRRANSFEVCGHIPHLKPNQHQNFIIPKPFSVHHHQVKVAKTARYMSSTTAAEEQQLVDVTDDADVATAAASRKRGRLHSSRNIKAAPADPESAGEVQSSMGMRAGSCVAISQRREKHNSKERDRRRKIRMCCDELNTLVPFCEPDTDKATTLQWTITFLKYISKVYGDTVKEEFQKAFADKKGLFHESSCSSGQDPILLEMAETLKLPLTVEQ